MIGKPLPAGLIQPPSSPHISAAVPTPEELDRRLVSLYSTANLVEKIASAALVLNGYAVVTWKEPKMQRSALRLAWPEPISDDEKDGTNWVAHNWFPPHIDFSRTPPKHRS